MAEEQGFTNRILFAAQRLEGGTASSLPYSPPRQTLSDPARPAVQPSKDFQQDMISDVVNDGLFGPTAQANYAMLLDYALRPPGELFSGRTSAATASEVIADRFPGRPEGSLANVGTELAVGLAEPGPGEFANFLGAMLAPRGIMRMIVDRGDETIEFVDPEILARAPGNLLRRNEQEMQEFMNEIMQNPGGLQSPVMVLFDPKKGRWVVGEGNHRVEVARRLGIPVPVRVVQSDVYQTTARSIPRDALEAMKNYDPYGYIPSTLTPSEIGLPVVSQDEISRIVRERFDRGEIDATPEEMEEFAEFMRTREPRYILPRIDNQALQDLSDSLGE